MFTDIEKPSEVLYTEIDNSKGTLVISPLEPGYGTTIGSAYRRVLLSSLYGYAIVSIAIPGVYHEFSVVPGVLEDTVDLILNLKQVRFRPKSGITVDAPQRISINIKKSDVFLAGDIEKFTSVFEIANPDHVICNIAPDHIFSIDIVVCKGKGYSPASDRLMNDGADSVASSVSDKTSKTENIGMLPIDAIYSPIKNVRFDVENTRVGNRTDYDRLVLEVTTDKTTSPKYAIDTASNILLGCFSIMLNGGALKEGLVNANGVLTSDELSKRKILKKQLKDLPNDLSTRSLNCLQGANINTLGDLLNSNIEEIKKIQSFGAKSLREVTALIEKCNKEIKGL